MRRLAIPLIIVCWLAGAAVAFWFFVGRTLRPVTRPAGAATIDALTSPMAPLLAFDTAEGRVDVLGGQKVTVLNFWSPDCGCSRFLEPHVRDLVRRYGARGVLFLTLVQTEPDQEAKSRGLQVWADRNGPTTAIVDTGEIARRFGVWAAPAAVVIDGRGRIVYVGSYNVGRSCSNEDTAFADKAIQATLLGKKPPVANLPFYGCQIRGKSTPN